MKLKKRENEGKIDLSKNAMAIAFSTDVGRGLEKLQRFEV